MLMYIRPCCRMNLKNSHHNWTDCWQSDSVSVTVLSRHNSHRRLLILHDNLKAGPQIRGRNQHISNRKQALLQFHFPFPGFLNLTRLLVPSSKGHPSCGYSHFRQQPLRQQEVNPDENNKFHSPYPSCRLLPCRYSRCAVFSTAPSRRTFSMQSNALKIAGLETL